MEPVLECENEWQDSDGDCSSAEVARLAALIKDMERQVVGRKRSFFELRALCCRDL